MVCAELVLLEVLAGKIDFGQSRRVFIEFFARTELESVEGLLSSRCRVLLELRETELSLDGIVEVMRCRYGISCGSGKSRGSGKSCGSGKSGRSRITTSLAGVYDRSGVTGIRSEGLIVRPERRAGRLIRLIRLFERVERRRPGKLYGYVFDIGRRLKFILRLSRNND